MNLFLIAGLIPRSSTVRAERTHEGNPEVSLIHEILLLAPCSVLLLTQKDMLIILFILILRDIFIQSVIYSPHSRLLQ